MAQILVKTPVTSNGSNPVLDSRGQIIYKETILEEAARNILEKQNEKLPQHLKKIITSYNGKPSVTKEVATLNEEPTSENVSETKPKNTTRGKDSSK